MEKSKRFQKLSLGFLVLAAFMSVGCRGKPEQHNVIGCEVYGMDKQLVWSLPNHGGCVFFPDGHVVAAKNEFLRMFDSSMKKVWEKKVTVHHQIKRYGNRLHLISEDYLESKEGLVRFDRLLILDRNGDELKKMDFQVLESGVEGLRRIKHPIPENLRRRPEAGFEISHFNSFYQIPENALARRNAVFKSGNYIANDLHNGLIFIVDSDLEKVLWSLSYDKILPGERNIHDVQVLEDGRLLFFFNRKPESGFSTINTFHPMSFRLQEIYRGNPPTSFHTEIMGGVQWLDNGTILFNDLTKGAWSREVDLKSGREIWSLHTPHHENQTPKGFQEIKRQDLTEFLQRNRGI